MHFPGEVQHALEAGQGFLALVVVVAEADAQLVGDGPLLDAADEQVHVLLLQKAGQFQRVGVVDDDGALVAELAQLLVILLVAGLRADHHGPHAQVAQGPTSENALKAPPT